MKLTPDEQRIMALEVAVRTLAAQVILQGGMDRLRETLDLQIPKAADGVIAHPRYPASDIAEIRRLAEAYLLVGLADGAP